jgi:hypothetical protein
MKKISLIVLAITASLCLVWWFHRPTTPLPAPTVETQIVRTPMASSPKNEQSTNNSTESSFLKDVEERYHQGLIDKGEAMREVFVRQNNQPQAFYGKIIDQDGHPIAEVEVNGNIQMMGGLGDGAKNQAYKTQSDSEGLFDFTGKQGWQLNITVKKDGYLMGERGEGYNGPPGEKTSPTDRAILTMWKLHGPEPLVGYSIESKIPHNGTPAIFDIATQKENPDGDLRATLIRTPLEVRRGKDKFDWNLKVEMPNGGIMGETDSYPYWAPENGYASFIEMNVSSNDVPWRSSLTQNFYIKNSHGQYGRMQVSVYAALTPASIKFDFTINPSGSQNLEPAPKK